ncbi:MAG: hypothetical protein MJK13_13340 [Pseudomonadales bacterium]|nr:hypothetical protein [Pseudomonadales bacterium]
MVDRLAAPADFCNFTAQQSCWNDKWQCHALKIKPGEFYVSNQDIVITTVLGSCIAACVYDQSTGFGGMNHFMLPHMADQDNQVRCLRYGIFAMEQLINQLMKQGSSCANLQLKIAGGGNMLAGTFYIGQQNIHFIETFITDENLHLVSSDTGGDQARRVAFFPASGKMLVNNISLRQDQRLIKEESDYRNETDHQLDTQEVELF